MGDVAARGRVEAGPASDFTVRVEATGLDPATTYWYGFEAGGARSPVGRTRTAPEGPVDRLRLGFACCAHFTTGFFNAYRRLAEHELDLVVHLGDYLYEDEARKNRGTRLHRPSGRLLTLADYRARHAQYKADPDLRALHERHPIVAVWDDHELAGNAWRDGAARHNRRTDGDWEARKEAATRAYLEWMPVRSPDPSDPLRLWRRLPLGDLCDLLVLDTRLAGRDRPAAGRRPVLGVWRRDRALLGEAQWRWLEEELAGPGAHWRLLASQVMVAPVHLVAVPRGLERFGAVGDGFVVNAGQWDGYPEERERLFDLLASRGGDTVVVSGDLHSSWASELRRDGRPVATELSTPAVSAPSFARALAPPVPGGRQLLEWLIRTQNRHLRFVATKGHGYVVVEVTPERVEAEWWHVDTVSRRDGAERCVARWAVRWGDPRLVGRLA